MKISKRLLFWNIFLFFWCVLYYKFYFLCVYRILCHFLYIWRYFKDIFKYFLKKMSQKCEEFSYELFVCENLRFWVILVVIFKMVSPPPPSPASMSKFHSRGKNMEHNCFFMIFCCFYENKLDNCIKTTTSCSIRRVTDLRKRL